MSPPVTAGPIPAHRHLPALDGLRFIAALCVLFGHGYDYLVLYEQTGGLSGGGYVILGTATIGMTLFFVLSGFVIHYNYSRSITEPGGRRNFFVARFARLYPLFFLVFLVEAVRTRTQANGAVDVLGPAPLYLTFTQSWWFWVFNGRMSAQAYNGASGLMWSLSTEAFFYASYPFLARRLRGISGKPLLGLGAGLAVTAAVLVALLIDHRGPMGDWVVFHTGSKVTQSDFTLWLVFYSPWVRMFEFLLGAVAAQYAMTATVRTNRAMLASAASIVAIASTYVFVNYNKLPCSQGLTTCLAALFAVVIANAAMCDTPISRVLSAKWMIAGGEASYSLYLLHYWVMHEFGLRIAWSHPVTVRIWIWIGLMLVSIVVARISYLVYERPCLRLIRRLAAPTPKSPCAS